MLFLNVLPIGLGNFGCQVVNNLLVKGGFENVIEINSSVKDMLTLDKRGIPYLVGDQNGTGKDRQLGVQYLQDSKSLILSDNTFKKLFTDADIILVYASSGGGFGSGASPELIKEMKQLNPDKCIIAITTLPSLSEAYTSQVHSIEFLNEIENLEIPYIIYDNNKFNSMTSTEMCDHILNGALLDAQIIRGDYMEDDTSGGIDQRDLLTMLSQPGRVVISSLIDLEESTIKNNNVVQTLFDEIQHSTNADIAYDKEILASCFISSLRDIFNKYLSEGQIKDNIQTTFGVHITDYRNIHWISEDDDESIDYISIMLSGLSLPVDRLKQTMNSISETEKTITNRKKSKLDMNTSANKLSLKHSSFGAKNNNPPAKQNKSTVKDLMNQVSDLKEKPENKSNK